MVVDDFLVIVVLSLSCLSCRCVIGVFFLIEF